MSYWLCDLFLGAWSIFNRYSLKLVANSVFKHFLSIVFLMFIPSRGSMEIFLYVYWDQRTKPITVRFEELNPGSLWPWQRLYLCDSCLILEERICYMDCGGAWLTCEKRYLYNLIDHAQLWLAHFCWGKLTVNLNSNSAKEQEEGSGKENHRQYTEAVCTKIEQRGKKTD